MEEEEQEEEEQEEGGGRRKEEEEASWWPLGGLLGASWGQAPLGSADASDHRG